MYYVCIYVINKDSTSNTNDNLTGVLSKVGYLLWQVFYPKLSFRPLVFFSREYRLYIKVTIIQLLIIHSNQELTHFVQKKVEWRSESFSCLCSQSCQESSNPSWSSIFCWVWCHHIFQTPHLLWSNLGFEHKARFYSCFDLLNKESTVKSTPLPPATVSIHSRREKNPEFWLF